MNNWELQFIEYSINNYALENMVYDSLL